MNAAQTQALKTLREAGYAVVVFNPEELAGVDPSTVEDILVERGWLTIENLSPSQEETP